ncbi:MAG: branched-chain amino acid transaminase [Eggerthellaceae bacterium]|nr:branched-chain amino acid transaminase [Eggerthellaceae bacterium]
MIDPMKTDFIWKNGELIKFEDATTHVLTHTLHYGSGVFEGIRCYYNEKIGQSNVFLLKEHMQRLVDSCKICSIPIDYSVEELCEAALLTIRANKLKACYIRPIVYYGYGQLGVNPKGCPVEVVIAVWEWGAYLGEGALENGIRTCISSWRQRSINAIPPEAKTTASYMNSILAKEEALSYGFDEAILLNEEGKVCEGSGESIFAVKNGIMRTPPIADGVLSGLTRFTVLGIAETLGIPVETKSITRASLYTADEVFFSGTAAEVTPICEIDDRSIGKPGPVTKKIQEAFFKITSGEEELSKKLLTPVYK